MQIKPSTLALVLFIGTVLLIVLTFSGGDSDTKRTHHFRDPPPVISENKEEEEEEEEEDEEAETNSDKDSGSDNGNPKDDKPDKDETDNSVVTEDKDPEKDNKDTSSSEDTNESGKPDKEDSDDKSSEPGQDLDGDKDESDDNSENQGGENNSDGDNANSADDKGTEDKNNEDEQETPDNVKANETETETGNEVGGSTTGDLNVAYDDDEDSDDYTTSTVPATTTTATTTTPSPTTAAPSTTATLKTRKKSQVFVDLGARAGDATVAFLNDPQGEGSYEAISGLGSFGVEWDLWLFEASPIYTDRLVKLVDRLKTDPRLTVFLRNDTAICPENGTKRIRYDQPGCENCTKVVQCVSLTDVLARYDKQDAVLLKIDAPCAEVRLLIESLKSSDSLSLVDAWAVRWTPPCAEEEKLKALRDFLKKSKARILEWNEVAP